MHKILTIAALIATFATPMFAEEKCEHFEVFLEHATGEGFQVVSQKGSVLVENNQQSLYVVYVDKDNNLVEAIFAGEEVCWIEMNATYLEMGE